MNHDQPQLDRPLIPGTRAPLSAGQLWRMLWARRWLIGAIVGLFASAAVAAALFVPDHYVSRVSLVIDIPNQEPGGSGRFPTQLADNYLATQIDLLQSDKVLLRVVEQRNMTADDEARQTFEASAPAEASFARWLADRIGDKLTVDSGSTSRLIRVGYKDESPRRAAAIANAVVRAYQHISAEIVSKPADSRLAQYDDYLDKLSSRYDSAEQKVAAAKQTAGVIDMDNTGGGNTQRLKDLGIKLNQAQADQQAAQAKVDRITRLQRAGRPVSAQAEILSSNYVQKLKGRLVALRAERARQAKTLGANHPEMQSLDAQIATLRSRLRHEINSYIQANRGEARIAADREAGLRESLAKERSDVLSQQKKRDDIAALVRQRDSAKQVYQAALNQYDQVLGGTQMPQYNISVISWATPPTTPTNLGGRNLLLLALVMGALVGSALAILLELVSRRVRHAEDVTRELGLPVLGELPAPSS